jgi:hypothetical protein
MADKLIIDANEFRAALSPSLGEVELVQDVKPRSNPKKRPPAPQITDYWLVPNTKYRWEYNMLRYLRLGYSLERNGRFEAGYMHILSKVIKDDKSMFTTSSLTFVKEVSVQVSSSLGVLFTLLNDPSAGSTKNPKFGLAFVLTTITSPWTGFPKIRAWVDKYLPIDVSDEEKEK